MKNKLFAFLILFVCIIGTSGNLQAQKRKTSSKTRTTKSSVIVESPFAGLSPEQQKRLTAFYFAWETINRNYFDQTFSGLDWNKIREEYEPRIRKTENDAQLHDILQEMINRLDKSHFAIIPPEVYQAIENAKIQAKLKEDSGNPLKNEEMPEDETVEEPEFDFDDLTAKYGIGIELRLMENQFVVSRVEANSTAAKAGIKTGYVVEKINDISLKEFLERIEIHYAKIRNIKRHLAGELTDYMLTGEKDSAVALTVLNETGEIKKFEIARERLKGETISLGENFPEQFLRFETASLNEQTGYIKFDLFALPVIEKFCAALTELKDKRAIVIDLRGNGGGILGSMIGLGGMLTETSVDLGTSIYRVGSENMAAASKAKNYKGKIVVLVDNQTASAAEVFAAALQENNRALIVGERTAGEALPAVPVELPTGAVMLYPIANFKTRNGNFLEGKGVEPNYTVVTDRKSLLTGIDAPLDTALKLIKEDAPFAKLLEKKMTALTEIKPPPPPPAPKPTALSNAKKLGEVTINAGSTLIESPSLIKDEKALKVISDFINAIGGEEALNKINSYSLKGTSGITGRGSKVGVAMNILRQKPDKYAEIMKSESLGEVRQIYNGNTSIVQADFGVNKDLKVTVNTAEVEIFAPINNLTKSEYFKSLKYQGAFDRMGKEAHVIEAITKGNLKVWLAFDVESKMFVSYTSDYFSIFYDDYRRVENVMLPFHILKQPLVDVRLDEIKINVPIEAGNFTAKENCYDKPL